MCRARGDLCESAINFDLGQLSYEPSSAASIRQPHRYLGGRRVVIYIKAAFDGIRHYAAQAGWA
jgi:hypothetical protein